MLESRWQHPTLRLLETPQTNRLTLLDSESAQMTHSVETVPTPIQLPGSRPHA